jgi:hypothetical protein
MARQKRFETWLVTRLGDADFGGMLLGEIVDDGERELELDRETLLRFLVKVTRGANRFRSENGLVTVR